MASAWQGRSASRSVAAAKQMFRGAKDAVQSLDVTALVDPEFDLAEKNLRSVIPQVEALMADVQKWRQNVEKLSESTTKICSTASGIFLDEDAKSSTDPFMQNLVKKVNKYRHANKALEDYSIIVDLCTSNVMLAQSYLDKLGSIVTSLEERKNLKNDYEHYTAKYRLLQTKEKTPEDKLKRNKDKLEKSEAEFFRFNEFLLNRMKTTYANRHKALEPVFSNLCIVMEMYFQQMKNPFQSITHDRTNADSSSKDDTKSILPVVTESSAPDENNVATKVLWEEGFDEQNGYRKIARESFSGYNSQTSGSDTYGWSAGFSSTFKRKVVKIVSKDTEEGENKETVGAVSMLVTGNMTVGQLIEATQVKLRRGLLKQEGIDDFDLTTVKGEQLGLGSFVLDAFSAEEQKNSAMLRLVMVPHEYASSSEDEGAQEDDQMELLMDDSDSDGQHGQSSAPQRPVIPSKKGGPVTNSSGQVRPQVPVKRAVTKEKCVILRVYDCRKDDVDFVTVAIDKNTNAKQLRHLVKKSYKKKGKDAGHFVFCIRYKVMQAQDNIYSAFTAEEKKHPVLHINMRADEHYHHQHEHKRRATAIARGDDEVSSSDSDAEPIAIASSGKPAYTPKKRRMKGSDNDDDDSD